MSYRANREIKKKSDENNTVRRYRAESKNDNRYSTPRI